MKSPLIYDQRDSKWILLGKILKIFGSRRVKQEIAKQGLKPADKAGIMFRAMIISMFFCLDVSYVLSELKEREELRNFAGILDVPNSDDLYRFKSRFPEENFIIVVNGILNSQLKSKRRFKATILVDSTDLPVDLNFHRRKITKKSLEDKDSKWAFSSSKGHYIGFKLTVALDYRTMQPLAFLIHSGSPNDAPLFDQILKELKNRRLIHNGDTLIFDKGYYSYNNYVNGILHYKIVPIIFPKYYFKIERVLKELNYPLSSFKGSKIKKNVKKLYERLVSEFKSKISNWKRLKHVRGLIEDWNKLTKKALNMDKIHSYTQSSVTKYVAINALLAALIILQGYNSKKAIQHLSEW